MAKSIVKGSPSNSIASKGGGKSLGKHGNPKGSAKGNMVGPRGKKL